MESVAVVGGVRLPPACLVPLLLSSAHLMQGEAFSIDRAVQFLTLAGVFMFMDEIGGGRVTWWLMSPFLTLAAAGTLFNLAFQSPPAPRPFLGPRRQGKEWEWSE